MTKPEDNGDGVKSIPVPMLTITFDPRTYLIAIGGSVPCWEFAEAMLHMALHETERKINEKRAQKRIEIAVPELLGNLKNGSA